MSPKTLLSLLALAFAPACGNSDAGPNQSGLDRGPETRPGSSAEVRQGLTGRAADDDPMVDHREDPMAAPMTEEEAMNATFLELIDGREDPVARYLRAEAAKENGLFDGITGVYKGDYEDVVKGVQAIQKNRTEKPSCSGEDQTFSLSDDLLAAPGADPFPRLISVACSASKSAASEFFIAASFSGARVDGGVKQGRFVEEVDFHNLEMFGWDPRGRGHYQFYETFELGSPARDEVEVQEILAEVLSGDDLRQAQELVAKGAHFIEAFPGLKNEDLSRFGLNALRTGDDLDSALEEVFKGADLEAARQAIADGKGVAQMLSDLLVPANIETLEGERLERTRRVLRAQFGAALRILTVRRIAFEASPTRCRGCHLTSSKQEPLAMRMTPIMNELRDPWTHWNAIPESTHNVKFSFARAAESLNFQRMFLPAATVPVEQSDLQDASGSAREFEVIIKAGHDKVARARTALVREDLTINGLEGAATVDQALDEVLGAIRPVFCAEQLNYVSERSNRAKRFPTRGQLFPEVAINDGLNNAYRATKTSWPEIKGTGSAAAWFGLPDFLLKTDPVVQLEDATLVRLSAENDDIDNVSAEAVQEMSDEEKSELSAAIVEALTDKEFAKLKGDKNIFRLPPLDQIPVRGNSDITMEKRVMSFLRILKPLDVVRAHAIDWQNAVESDFRCGLWQRVKEQAVDRVEPEGGKSPRAALVEKIEAAIIDANAAGKFGNKPPRISTIGWPLFQEIMQYNGQSLLLEGEHEEWPAAANKREWPSASFVVVDLTGENAVDRDEAMARAIEAGTLEACGDSGALCSGTMASFGNLLQARVEQFTSAKDGRERLTQERNARICRVTQHVQPEEADHRFVDLGVEALAFENCCGVPQDDYLELRRQFFGEDSTRLTTHAVSTDEQKEELGKLARHIFSKQEAHRLGVAADLTAAELKELATHVDNWFARERGRMDGVPEKLVPFIKKGLDAGSSRTVCGVKVFRGLVYPERLPEWRENPTRHTETFICAAEHTPERFSARPSLPQVGDGECVKRNHFWKYDDEAKGRDQQRQEERVRSRATRAGRSTR